MSFKSLISQMQKCFEMKSNSLQNVWSHSYQLCSIGFMTLDSKIYSTSALLVSISENSFYQSPLHSMVRVHYEEFYRSWSSAKTLIMAEIISDRNRCFRQWTVDLFEAAFSSKLKVTLNSS